MRTCQRTDGLRFRRSCARARICAEGMKDMGKVIAELKARHGAQLDMGKASGLVKAALG